MEISTAAYQTFGPAASPLGAIAPRWLYAVPKVDPVESDEFQQSRTSRADAALMTSINNLRRFSLQRAHTEDAAPRDFARDTSPAGAERITHGVMASIRREEPAPPSTESWDEITAEHGTNVARMSDGNFFAMLTGMRQMSLRQGSYLPPQSFAFA